MGPGGHRLPDRRQFTWTGAWVPGRVAADAVASQPVGLRLSRINPGEPKAASPGQRCDPRGPRKPRCCCYWSRSAPQVGPWRKRKVRACPLARAPSGERSPSPGCRCRTLCPLPLVPPLLSSTGSTGTVGGTGRFASGMGETGAAEGRENRAGGRRGASTAWEPRLCAPGFPTAPNLVASLFCAQ